MPEMTRFVEWTSFASVELGEVYSLQIGRGKEKPGEESNAEIAENAEGAEMNEDKTEERKACDIRS